MLVLSLQTVFLVFVLFRLLVCPVIHFSPLIARYNVPGKKNCYKLAFSNMVVFGEGVLVMVGKEGRKNGAMAAEDSAGRMAELVLALV